MVQPLREEIPSEQEEEEEFNFVSRTKLTGPVIFGVYSPEKKPQQIPYHLYLLVKDATDIMKQHHSNSIDESKLTLVEKKIRFFCRYFNCHLPTGWEYNRDDANSVVASYDTTREPRYNMDGYTPFSFSRGVYADEFDSETELSRRELSAVMFIIHSRETPAIWKLCPSSISFYCKTCSCFGIDYHRLEAASKDDVSLMNVGLRPRPNLSDLPWYY